MDFQTLRLQIQSPIARIGLARPDDSNRIDARLLHELAAACETIAAEESLCVALLTADGPDFCAGWADQTIQTGQRPPLDPFGCLTALPIPVLTAVQGGCSSAGLELALACDLRIAAENARFALPEVGGGTLPLAGGSQRLPRVAGRGVATAMLLLGEELDARAAYRAGIVSRLFPADELSSQAQSLAERIAAHGPLALRYAKEAVRYGMELPLDQALRYELDLSVILQTTQDRGEGVQAFLEKRPPKFEGR